MSEVRNFATDEDFRRSLENKIQSFAHKHSQDLERLRRNVAFERLLARFFFAQPSQWLLKGGFAMELQFHQARATRDIDLVCRDNALLGADSKYMLTALRQIAAVDMDDHFTFIVQEARREVEGPKYGGARFSIQSKIGFRPFVTFPLDVAIAETVVQPIRIVEATGWLGVYGYPMVKYHIVNREQHYAEKLHAYTMPRASGLNSRVKDLVDMVLLIQDGKLEIARLRRNLEEVFTFRGTHSIPDALSSPPNQWNQRFVELARECGLEMSISEAFRLLEQFHEISRV